jgi:hypothetical protein
LKDELEESSFTVQGKKNELNKLDEHLEDVVKSEGEPLNVLLGKLQDEYQETKEFFEIGNDSDVSDNEGSKNNASQSETNNQNSTKDKQSPIDFVVEKQKGEMPYIPDSDGGE